MWRFPTEWMLALAMLTGGCDSSLLGGDDTEDSAKAEKKSKKKKKKKKSIKSDEAESAKADDGSIPPPKPGDIPTLRVGAWSKYKMTHADGSGGKVTWAVIGDRPPSEFQVEVTMEHRISFSAQAWVDAPDGRDPKGMELKELKINMGGRVQTLPGGKNSPAALTFSQFLDSAVPTKFEGSPQEDVTVEAGTFRGCYKFTTEQKAFGQVLKATVWSHPHVPAPSMVKHVSEDGATLELIEYAQSGAKASF